MKKTSRIPAGGWNAAVPTELHGHKKKLAFFIRCLDDFCRTYQLEPSEVKVAEIGCSNGRNISFPLAELGYRIKGIDIHAPSIAWAEANNDFANASFVCQDFTTSSMDEKFDVVILSDILEHVNNPLDFLRLSAKHLNKDGMVLICVPNGYGPYEIEQRFLRITRLDKIVNFMRDMIKRLKKKSENKKIAYNHDSGHIHYFSMADIEQLACKSGLRINEKANGALFGGDISYTLGNLFPFIVKPSLSLADQFPPCMVTTWYFRLSPIDYVYDEPLENNN